MWRFNKLHVKERDECSHHIFQFEKPHSFLGRDDLYISCTQETLSFACLPPHRRMTSIKTIFMKMHTIMPLQRHFTTVGVTKGLSHKILTRKGRIISIFNTALTCQGMNPMNKFHGTKTQVAYLKNEIHHVDTGVPARNVQGVVHPHTHMTIKRQRHDIHHVDTGVPAINVHGVGHPPTHTTSLTQTTI
jgi:hypothetical protein